MNHNFDDYNVVCIGDIHGQFSQFRFNLSIYIEKYTLTKTLFIICGDCGFFGKNVDTRWIAHENKKIHDILVKSNNRLAFFRGNHDDPKLFEDDYHIPRGSDRIHVFLDYDTIDSNIYGRLLIIPGAFSIDRGARKENISYWTNELIRKLVDEEIINLGKFDIILSHSLPSFVKMDESMYNAFKRLDIDAGYWDFDEKLKTENEYLVKIQSYIKPKYWISGHYHKSIIYMMNETECTSLSINEFYPLKQIKQ